MTTFELVGLFCLLSVWLAAVLSALDVLVDWRTLRALRQQLTGQVQQGLILQGHGPSGALATHALTQRARPLDAPTPALGLWDHAWRCELHGGAIEVDGQSVQLEAGAGIVWPEPSAQTAAATLDSTSFERLFISAQATKGGATRVVTMHLLARQPVWLAMLDGRRLVSAIDPLQWVRRRQTVCLAFVALAIAWALAGTVLAISGEAFGFSAKAGALVLIGLFLGLSPLLVKVRESCRTPDLKLMGGRLSRPEEAVEAAKATVVSES
jgi:hypothetical protein